MPQLDVPETDLRRGRGVRMSAGQRSCTPAGVQMILAGSGSWGVVTLAPGYRPAPFQGTGSISPQREKLDLNF